MHLFYCPDLSAPILSLPDDEAYHAANVLRLKTGTTVLMTDGKGRMITAKFLEITAKHCQAVIISEVPVKQRQHRLHLAVAPTKQIDRFEWFLEKATEIGIEEITPLHCRFSERKEVKPERLEKLLVSAAKQSRHALFPVLHPMQKFNEFINTQELAGKYALIGHCAEGTKIEMKAVFQAPGDALILIGPEGDFSTEEITMAINKGFQAVAIGDYRLRSETAAIASAMTFAFSFD